MGGYILGRPQVSHAWCGSSLVFQLTDLSLGNYTFVVYFVPDYVYLSDPDVQFLIITKINIDFSSEHLLGEKNNEISNTFESIRVWAAKSTLCSIFFFAKPFFFLKKANYSIRYVHRIVCLSSGFVHIYLCKNTCLLFEAFNLRHTYCLD